jgi:hypothetical protein
LCQQDKEDIIKYAKHKGINESTALATLNKYIDALYLMDDAHDFSYHAFLVFILGNFFELLLGNYEDLYYLIGGT